MAIKIPLTQGKFTLVDEIDIPLINHYKWSAGRGNKTTWYAITTVILPDGRRKTLRLHRLIMSAREGEVVDHINHDGLDNRRENLRPCKGEDNARNRRRGVNNRSGFKGVSWHTESKKWVARIRSGQKFLHLGCFIGAEDAARAYDRAARNLHGEFAHLNFPEGGSQ